MSEGERRNSGDDPRDIEDFPGEPKQTRLREADDEDKGQIQRSGHTPGGKDVSRGSEPATSGASKHRG